MDYESPDYLRTSLAAAMTLRLRPGIFYRKAKLRCINLLLHYRQGCFASCAYCGLARQNTTSVDETTFIRVHWPFFSIEKMKEKISEHQTRLGRICISMITHPKAVEDTIAITTTLIQSLSIPVSLLITPTIVTPVDLKRFKQAGADRIGIAIDAATPELFDRYRGTGVGGPHVWDRYWECFREAVQIFGRYRVGSHLIVGLGETERDMVSALLLTRSYGGVNHLFSFFPERGSALANHSMPGIGHYRRLQLARYLIDDGLLSAQELDYDNRNRIIRFRISEPLLEQIINSGEPFRTSGCLDMNGNVACNRPYANSLPGPDIRNFPFPPDKSDIEKIRSELVVYE